MGKGDKVEISAMISNEVKFHLWRWWPCCIASGGPYLSIDCQALVSGSLQ